MSNNYYLISELRAIQIEVNKIDKNLEYYDDSIDLYDEDSNLTEESLEAFLDRNAHWKFLIV